MLTDAQIAEVVELIQGGSGLKAALLQIGVDPTLSVMVWLQSNHYDRLTDAKHGEGHAQAQAALRLANRTA